MSRLEKRKAKKIYIEFKDIFNISLFNIKFTKLEITNQIYFGLIYF